MILLAGIIIWNWPTGPVDFGSQGPWSGLVLELDTKSLSDPPLLIVASLPATDETGQKCSLIVGTAIWDGVAQDPRPENANKMMLLLDGETDALRLQKIQLEDDTAALYRSTRGEIRVFQTPTTDQRDDLIGGILQGQTVIPPWSSDGAEQSTITITLPRELSAMAFEARCDDRLQKRWRSARGDFRQLWAQAQQENPELLAPFLHGKVVLRSHSQIQPPR
jgi:hypothetical protein